MLDASDPETPVTPDQAEAARELFLAGFAAGTDFDPDGLYTSWEDAALDAFDDGYPELAALLPERERIADVPYRLMRGPEVVAEGAFPPGDDESVAQLFTIGLRAAEGGPCTLEFQAEDGWRVIATIADPSAPAPAIH